MIIEESGHENEDCVKINGTQAFVWEEENGGKPVAGYTPPSQASYTIIDLVKDFKSEAPSISPSFMVGRDGIVILLQASI